MGYDAMANDFSAPNSAAARDGAAKKKRGNRSAKLKQWKLDVRREQWLSQVKENKNMKTTGKNTGSQILASPGPHPPIPRSRRAAVAPERSPRGLDEEEREEAGGVGQEIISDLDSLPHSSQAGEPRKMSSGDNGNGNSLSSGSSLWSSSRSVSDAEDEEAGIGREEVEEEENGVLDDWEAAADALSVEDNHGCQNSGPMAPPTGLTDLPASNPSVQEATKPEPIRSGPRAWRLDDEFRPQSLPSISKQVSFQASMGLGWVGLGAAQKGILLLPSSCPICYEDLDPTDSSFLPCPCGFRLCLFCHKKILEEDGRCPGCRKKYEVFPAGGMATTGRETANVLLMRLSRSCSMGPRY